MIWADNSLEILGLSKTEMAILGVLDTAKSVQEVASGSKVSRTGVNHALKGLDAKGLVSYFKHGKRRSYIALSPAQLSVKLQKAADELSMHGNTTKSARIKTSKGSEFVIYAGIKEIIPAHERIASLNKNERIRAIQPNKSWMNLHKKLSSKELIRFNEAIKQNWLIIDAVLQDNAYRLYGEFFKNDPVVLKGIANSFTGRMADYTLVSSNYFNQNAEIWIYRKTFFIINWEEEVAIEINNQDIMGFMQDMYEIVKSDGKKIDHNRALQDIIEGSKG